MTVMVAIGSSGRALERGARKIVATSIWRVRSTTA